MIGPRLSPTAETTQTLAVDLSAKAVAMIKARCDEYAQLARDVKERKARQERIQREVADLFAREGQADALLAGTAVDGYRMKVVQGVSRKLDKPALMRALDLDAESLDAFFVETLNKPYVRISAPGESGRDE